MFQDDVVTPIVEIRDEITRRFGVRLFIKREDQTDPYISGNKYRKLKYNLLHAKQLKIKRLLTFGGAYSNHIHAVAYCGAKFGFETIGIIRGEEQLPLNPTLRDATSFGMALQYMSRSDYAEKNSDGLKDELKKRYGQIYIIPEGGSNNLAVKGCAEILSDDEKKFDHICCSCGTGGTLAGIIVSLSGKKKVWGFPALKNGSFLEKDIKKLIYDFNPIKYQNWSLVLDYHFGGYAKHTNELIDFINQFKKKHDIQLDPIYTGKLLFGVYENIKNKLFKPGEKVLAIHTGGLQGIKGFNARFGPLIQQAI